MLSVAKGESQHGYCSCCSLGRRWRTRDMSGGNGSYCCLGVLQGLAVFWHGQWDTNALGWSCLKPCLALEGCSHLHTLQILIVVDFCLWCQPGLKGHLCSHLWLWCIRSAVGAQAKKKKKKTKPRQTKQKTLNQTKTKQTKQKQKTPKTLGSFGPSLLNC